MTLPIPKAPKHRRMKEKRARTMNAMEIRHANRIAMQGCWVCRKPAQIHHEREHGSRRDHRYIAALCAEHHMGPHGRHGLGHDGFEREYGINLRERVRREWERSEMEMAA